MGGGKSITAMRLVVGISWLGVVAPAIAGSHTWDTAEAFSSADGTIWFIEIHEANGTPNEVGVGGHAYTNGLGEMFTICVLTSNPDSCNVESPTSNRSILFGSPAYEELAAIQGAPPPDQVVDQVAFVGLAGGTLSYTPWDSWAHGALPADGINSLNRSGGAAPNSPTNYAGETGTVDASDPPPATVPGGAGAGAPMLVGKLAADGSILEVSWDTATCAINDHHNLLFGQGSDLPESPGGTYGLDGAACGLGAVSPYTWTSVPEASDGTGLIWWVLVAANGSGTEGSWGTHDTVNERQGPGANGSSGTCAVTDKDITNTCGQ